MLKLNDLRDKPRATKDYKRVGRGQHNSSGNGFKGQKQRSGVALGNFQGGQTAIERRLPKHRIFFVKPKMATVALESIDRLIATGAITMDAFVDFTLLKKLKLIKKVEKFKVVGSGEYAIKLASNAISKGALESLQKVGGSWMSAKEYNKQFELQEG